MARRKKGAKKKREEKRREEKKGKKKGVKKKRAKKKGAKKKRREKKGGGKSLLNCRKLLKPIKSFHLLSNQMSANPWKIHVTRLACCSVAYLAEASQ